MDQRILAPLRGLAILLSGVAEEVGVEIGFSHPRERNDGAGGETL